MLNEEKIVTSRRKFQIIKNMKKLLLSIVLIFAAILVFADEQSSSNPKKELGGVIVSHAKVGGLKRVPSNTDIILVLEESTVLDVIILTI